MIGNQLLLQALNGLVVGSSLALVAAGLALLFGVLDIINFAQGDFFMMGAYAVWFGLAATHNYALSVIASVVLVGIIGGVLLTLLTWPLLGKPQVLVLLATLGLSLILQQGANKLIGGDTKLVEPPLASSVSLGTIAYPVYDLVIIAAGMLTLALGFFALQYTKYGIWLRAVAQNRTMAAVLGVPVRKVYILAFIVTSGLAALAGSLLVPVTSVYPTIGSDVILTGFIVVVAGGLGNFRGAAVLSIIVGEIQALGSLLMPPAEVQLVLFGMVIILLAARSRRQTALVRL